MGEESREVPDMISARLLTVSLLAMLDSSELRRALSCGDFVLLAGSALEGWEFSCLGLVSVILSFLRSNVSADFLDSFKTCSD